MEKIYDEESILLKLLYYCNQKREVYFKRENVSEYLITSNIFEKSNRQSFDGDLSYFGYDIKKDIDNYRILLLRGKYLNDKCLLGKLNIKREKNKIIVNDNEEIIKLLNKRNYEITDKETTKKILNGIRLNTSALGALVFNRDNYKCLLCDINDKKLLVCSHIKPWKTNDGRLDLNNVLILCTLHDALFDKGYISFDVQVNSIYSRDEIFQNKGIISFLSNSYHVLNLSINNNMKNYIKYHYDTIFHKVKED
jgi:hypothetical protein